MRTTVKILVSCALLVTALFIAIVTIVARPQSVPQMAMATAVVLGLAAPLLLLAVLPWCARPAPAPCPDPRTTTIARSTPRLLLRTIFGLVALAAILFVAPMLVTALASMAISTIDAGRLTSAIGSSLGLMICVIAAIAAAGRIITGLWRSWRWRRWPLLVIDDRGLSVPDRSDVMPWHAIAQVEIHRSRDYSTRLVIGGHLQRRWLFGSYPETIGSIEIGVRRGSAAAVRDAVMAHPGFVAASES